jgi:hypothetical protein
MRWLVHGNLTSVVADALKRHGHVVQLPGEIELAPDASPEDVLKTAHAKQLDVVTNDASVANAMFETPVKFGRTIVFLQLEGGDVEQDDAVDRLFERYKRLTPGKLYTVTGSRVKIRQLPGV